MPLQKSGMQQIQPLKLKVFRCMNGRDGCGYVRTLTSAYGVRVVECLKFKHSAPAWQILKIALRAQSDKNKGNLSGPRNRPCDEKCDRKNCIRKLVWDLHVKTELKLTFQEGTLTNIFLFLY